MQTSIVKGLKNELQRNNCRASIYSSFGMGWGRVLFPEYVSNFSNWITAMIVNVNKNQAELLFDCLEIEILDVKKANKEADHDFKLYDYIRKLRYLQNKFSD